MKPADTLAKFIKRGIAVDVLRMTITVAACDECLFYKDRGPSTENGTSFMLGPWCYKGDMRLASPIVGIDANCPYLKDHASRNALYYAAKALEAHNDHPPVDLPRQSIWDEAADLEQAFEDRDRE